MPTQTTTMENTKPEQQVAEKAPPYSAYPESKKRFFLGIVTAAGLFGPLCGAVYLPSLTLYRDVFNTSGTVINATVSVYMAVFAIAPLIGAAAADFGGRKTVYIVTLASFLVANILLASVPANIGALFVLRIFQAFGACIVTSIGAGTITDIFEPARRAFALAIFLLGPQLGPILGPLIGGQFATESRWRWAFGFLALACAPVYLLILFCLPETLRCLVGNGEAFVDRGWFALPRFRQKPLVEEGKYPKPPKLSLQNYIKLLTQPSQLIVFINGALSFAGLYLIYVTFPSVWEERFGFSTQEVGYAYLSPGIALFIASIITGRFSDARRAKLKAANPNKKIAPETRLPIQILGFIISAAGKTMYGWFTRYELHPAAGLTASALAAIGTAIIFVTSTSFQTECAPAQSATIVALAGLVRNIAAAIAAVIVDSLVKKMGYGWCFTGVAVLDVICIVGILGIIWRGRRGESEASNS
ncbi:major facilitator superfamily domain-containing protein [Aspergillus granulosus]|uniref:Major facilitator superfamily domain-containing protein n=1 Tax=Aspergillus granulosus TaxID=176169 RepID=A0ABR4GYG3_9EURO